MKSPRATRFRLPALFLLALFFSTTAAAAEGTLDLTLKEALRMAVARNLEVKAEIYNPAIGEADIRRNRGIYDTLLTFDTSYENSSIQSPSRLLTGASISRDKDFVANAGVSQLLPIGGTVGFFFNNLWNRNNANTSLGFLDEYWQSNVTLNYTQPLLKNFGRQTTELSISVALNNKTASVEQFRNKLIDVVTRVRTAYYTLYSLKENLEAKNTALNLARKILEDTKGRVRAGVLPAMEILNAEFGVATREKERIDAEKNLRDQMDAVRLLIQVESSQVLNPIDPPTRDRYPVDEEEAIKLALKNRPDLKAQRVNLQTLDLQTKVAHNRILPDLSFVASGALTGLGQDYTRDLDKVGSGEYPVWSVGLQFTYPIGNRDAKNSYIMSKLKTEQGKVQVQNLEEGIKNEVRSAIRGVHANYLQLDVAARGLAYAEERLRAYIKKNEVGLATTKDVVDVQNDFVAAKVNQLRAQADYTIAIGQLWKATGEILEREAVTINTKEPDALYDKNSL